MSILNNNSRTKNAFKSAIVGSSSQILKVLFGFGYRSLFLHFLTAVYLGINGLFSNILQMLSMAELGITTAIIYRFYAPISRNDIEYVGRLMNFFRKIYLCIAGVILLIGLAILPLIQYLINDINEVPSDVNIYLVYCLFLGNTVSSYLFTYKLSLLTADQKYYIVSIVDLAVTIIKYLSQLVILFVTRNYTLTLAVGLFSTLLINYLLSLWVTRQYKPIFDVKETISKEDRIIIFSDTRACMCHKIGTTVLNGTDNAVLSKMISLEAVGLYSNYYIIVSNLQVFVIQLLGGFTSSIGNARKTMDSEEYYKVYKNLLFTGFWISNVVFVTLLVSVNDFIGIWIGNEYVLDAFTTLMISCQVYIFLLRIINGSFIGADGLFTKDIVRPLIEAILNLGISIVLTRKIGMAGVFMGTVISSMLTSFWREPYLLYKYSFEKPIVDYFKSLLLFVSITIIQVLGLLVIKSLLSGIHFTWITFFIEIVFCFVFVNATNIVQFHKRDEYQYMKTVLKRLLHLPIS